VSDLHDSALDAEADALRLAYLSLDAHAALPWADVVPRVQARWRRVALHVRSRFTVPTAPEEPRFAFRYAALSGVRTPCPGVYDRELDRFAPFFTAGAAIRTADALTNGVDRPDYLAWGGPGTYTITPEGAPDA
jgi:hypothetical protein